MSLLEGVVPASNPRRLHLMHWTQLLSEVKVSYLLGRMSSSVTPLGRTASQGGGLSSFSSVACFFGGDEHGLLSSKGHFWFQAGRKKDGRKTWDAYSRHTMSTISPPLGRLGGTRSRTRFLITFSHARRSGED